MHPKYIVFKIYSTRGSATTYSQPERTIILGEMYSEMKILDKNHRAIGFQSRRTQMSGSPNNDVLTENYNYREGQKW